MKINQFAACRVLQVLLCAAVLPVHAAPQFANTAVIALPARTASQLQEEVNRFLNEWHDDAAHSRLSYFDKMTPDAVYIGTDKTERWTLDEFKTWAKPHFARPSAWAFKVNQRHLQMTEDQSVIWFDEQLTTAMGLCQASGVIRNTPQGLKIAHYQLSLAVPNELVDYLGKAVRQWESSGKLPAGDVK
ncbi:nuclear transport factor 2 family protein [Undibacterium rugosum]|uniref:Nuclear transport factor 2 family protein n=1 Tax=Undibacterium rugosum TaxID=2762291 RepID=A0A923I2B0_9BURK|nr:nuclear transport factor 2 family protein [Undibacterium rugosum]MBC3935747.1 nuclear transport factor 2 family protein [Undibacterium rugosum]MBR7778490.1 nuclear transport factor 2 family protein [Undibacterium rugosum]